MSNKGRETPTIISLNLIAVVGDTMFLSHIRLFRFYNKPSYISAPLLKKKFVCPSITSTKYIQSILHWLVCNEEIQWLKSNNQMKNCAILVLTTYSDWTVDIESTRGPMHWSNEQSDKALKLCYGTSQIKQSVTSPGYSEQIQHLRCPCRRIAGRWTVGVRGCARDGSLEFAGPRNRRGCSPAGIKSKR